MTIDKLILIGASGHAKVVLDAIDVAGLNYEIEIRDDDSKKNDILFCGTKVVVPIGELNNHSAFIHVAIGDNKSRKNIISKISDKNNLLSVIHPAAVISEHANYQPGVFLSALSVVAPGANIGVSTIINHAAIVDHDTQVSDYCHIAPGAVVGGGVFIGEGSLIGSGAVIQPGVEIGSSVRVGSGAVVTKDIKSNVTVVGVPAR